MGIAKPKNYICKKELMLETFDDNGFDTGEYLAIEVGEIYQRTDEEYRLIGGEVRLDNKRRWVEISEETLAEFFEELAEDFCPYGERKGND